MSKKNKGITLTEVLIVVAIVVGLATLFLAAYFTQLKKGRDGKRKADLERIGLSFEDYFNDVGCYPADVSMFGDEAKCGSREEYPDGFAPYLASLPCDPLGQPYQVRTEAVSCPSWYAIYTALEYVDSQSETNECSSGCYIGEEIYNHAVSSGNISSSVAADAPPQSPTPTSVFGSGCGENCYIISNGCNSSSYCAPGNLCYLSGSCSGGSCCLPECRVVSCGTP